LELELELRSIPFRRKQELTVYYKGKELQRKYVPDLLVFERIVVELKAVAALCPDHESQIMNYMRITKQPIGYLINFGTIGKLQYKRLILSEFL
jgi:GxxExxY protein